MFNIGDRVIGINNINMFEIKNKIGTVKDIEEDDCLAIYFDEDIDGWSDTDLDIPAGHGLYVGISDVQKYDDIGNYDEPTV